MCERDAIPRYLAIPCQCQSNNVACITHCSSGNTPHQPQPCSQQGSGSYLTALYQLQRSGPILASWHLPYAPRKYARFCTCTYTHRSQQREHVYKLKTITLLISVCLCPLLNVDTSLLSLSYAGFSMEFARTNTYTNRKLTYSTETPWF